MASIVSIALGRAKRPFAALLVASLALAPAHAAPPVVSSAFQPVLIDGSVAPASSGEAFNVIVAGGVFHLWYRTGGTFTISDLRHATSTNGVDFTTDTGSFSFATNPFTTGTPPFLYYDAVSVVGGTYRIIHWTGNGDEGTYPDYNSNSSVSDVGATPSNSVLTHQGAINPIPGGTQGQTIGTFGIESGQWIGACGATAQQVCSVAYTDGSPPSVPATIYPAALDASGLFTSLGIPTGYINNHGDARSAGVGLEIAFTLRADPAGTRFDQQVYFSESSNGGASWSAPVGLLTGPPTLGPGFGNPGGNFAHPELLRLPGGNVLYVSTQDASGAFIIAVSGEAIAQAQGAPVPTLDPVGLAALLAMLALLAVPALRRRRSPSR